MVKLQLCPHCEQIHVNCKEKSVPDIKVARGVYSFRAPDDMIIRTGDRKIAEATFRLLWGV